MRRAWVALGLTAALAGCGGDETAVPVGGGNRQEGGSGGRRSTSTSGSGGSGGSAGESGNEAPDASSGPTPSGAAPQVEILEPSAARDPNEDEVLTAEMVTVKCRVTKSQLGGARNVDQSSVRIQLVDPENSMSVQIPGVVRALPDNEFEADFQLGALPNGPVHFVCAANDVGMPPETGMDNLDTFLDLGPVVTIVEPLDDSSHALKNPVVIKFEVQPAPVSADDDEADVADVHLEVIGQAIPATEAPDQPGLYDATVNFDDRTLFAMPPSSAQIIVTATNGRTPDAPVRRVENNITLDAEGPTITVMSPENYRTVRGEIVLVVNISDPSGVEEGSVIGRVNGEQLLLTDWEISGSTYVEQFDTRIDEFDVLTELSINIIASDSVGNESTVDHTLRLDNVPPLVSLDPPVIREWYLDDQQVRRCSDPFDPLGSDAASDLSWVYAASMYRILAFERTNGIAGQEIVYVAGVAEGSMRLFAQGDPSIPLLIDGNDDGVCDEINNDALDLADRPVQRTFTPMDVRGGSFFNMAANFSSPVHDASGFGCMPGTTTMPPGFLCPATAMTRVIHQPVEGKPRAIYGIQPTNGSTGACEGNTWLLLPSVGEGWVCLAARVEDQIGNVGVSRPIRVCVDDSQGAPPSCSDPGTDPPPSCVDNCALPDDLPPNYMHHLQQ